MDGGGGRATELMWLGKMTFCVTPEKKPAMERAWKTNPVKCECGGVTGTTLDLQNTVRRMWNESSYQNVPLAALGSPLQLSSLPCAADGGGGHLEFVHEDSSHMSPLVVSSLPVALQSGFCLCGLPQGNGVLEPGFSCLFFLFFVITVIFRFQRTFIRECGNNETLEKKLSMTSIPHEKVIVVNTGRTGLPSLGSVPTGDSGVASEAWAPFPFLTAYNCHKVEKGDEWGL